MPKKSTKIKVNYDYLVDKCKEAGLTQSDVSRLIGRYPNYLAVQRCKGYGLSEVEIDNIVDLLDLDANVFVRKEPAPKEKEMHVEAVITSIIQKIGELEATMARLEEKLETPTIVAIPMQPTEMASKIVGELLESGWCTKDDVLVEFNKHHIPIQYITDALKSNNAVAATAGVADGARTFYIKMC